MNQGDGSMTNYWQSPNLEEAAFNLAMADFDRDGLDDLFVGTFGDGRLRIFRNKPGLGFETWWEGSVDGVGYTGRVADVNGDGSPDLIVGAKNNIRVLINQTGHPRITDLAWTTSGLAMIWTTVPGRTYRVQFKNRHDGTEWKDMSGDVTAGGSNQTLVDPIPNESTQGFYRVVELP